MCIHKRQTIWRNGTDVLVEGIFHDTWNNGSAGAEQATCVSHVKGQSDKNDQQKNVYKQDGNMMTWFWLMRVVTSKGVFWTVMFYTKSQAYDLICSWLRRLGTSQLFFHSPDLKNLFQYPLWRKRIVRGITSWYCWKISCTTWDTQPCKYRDKHKLPINWCRILSCNSIILCCCLLVQWFSPPWLGTGNFFETTRKFWGVDKAGINVAGHVFVHVNLRVPLPMPLPPRSFRSYFQGGQVSGGIVKFAKKTWKSKTTEIKVPNLGWWIHVLYERNSRLGENLLIVHGRPGLLGINVTYPRWSMRLVYLPPTFTLKINQFM